MKRALLDATEDNDNDGDHLSKQDSNGIGAIDDNSASAMAGLIDAVSDEDCNRIKDEVFTPREKTQHLVDAWKYTRSVHTTR